MKSCKKVPLPHSAITKAPSLLPMMYTIRELCVELDIPRHVIRSWINSGLPFQRDQRQHFWINGTECRAWIEQKRQEKKKKSYLENNQAYCLRCRKVVIIQTPELVSHKGNQRLSGSCPYCESTVNKGIKNGQSRELQTDEKISSIQKRNQSAK